MENAAIETATQLQGDWTISGVVRQMDPLMKLSSQWNQPGHNITIDCCGIENIDLSGFQLLYVWLHCLRIKGVNPILINMPESVLESQNRLGLAPLFDSQENC